MRIRLIRHGMTEANERRLYCGSTDLPLSEQGVRELQRLKSESGSMGEPFGALCRANGSGSGSACLYVTSALKRAVQTLEILYDTKPDIMIQDLNEMNFGDFEMKSYDDLKSEPDYIRWISDPEHAGCPNGENRKIFTERVCQGLEELFRLECENIIVVSHGGVIVTMMERLFPVEQRNFYEWQPGYGKGYTLELNHKEFSIATKNIEASVELH